MVTRPHIAVLLHMMQQPVHDPGAIQQRLCDLAARQDPDHEAQLRLRWLLHHMAHELPGAEAILAGTPAAGHRKGPA